MSADRAARVAAHDEYMRRREELSMLVRHMELHDLAVLNTHGRAIRRALDALDEAARAHVEAACGCAGRPR